MAGGYKAQYQVIVGPADTLKVRLAADGGQVMRLSKKNIGAKGSLASN